MRKFLIKMLFRLLDTNLSYKDLDPDKVETWLLLQYGNPGLKEYFKLRDFKLLKSIAVGVSEKDYWILLGQRLELLSFMHAIDATHKKDEKIILHDKAKSTQVTEEAASKSTN